MEGLAGVTAIETNGTELTFKVAEPMIVPEEAVMVVMPPLSALAKPIALIVPTEV